MLRRGNPMRPRAAIHTRATFTKRVTEALLAVASFKRSKRLESKNSSSLVILLEKKRLTTRIRGNHPNLPFEYWRGKYQTHH